MTANDDGLKEVTIYTDGACEPNPGTGGYGAILIHGDIRKELHGGFRIQRLGPPLESQGLVEDEEGNGA